MCLIFIQETEAAKQIWSFKATFYLEYESAIMIQISAQFCFIVWTVRTYRRP